MPRARRSSCCRDTAWRVSNALLHLPETYRHFATCELEKMKRDTSAIMKRIADEEIKSNQIKSIIL